MEAGQLSIGEIVVNVQEVEADDFLGPFQCYDSVTVPFSVFFNKGVFFNLNGD